MTIINPNSIAGITSVTAEAGVMNFYKSDGTLAGLQLNGVNFNTTSGISTFNNVYVGGTITYEDVKNVDSVGIITAREGIKINADNKSLLIGASGDLRLIHDGSNSFVDDAGTGALRVRGSEVLIQKVSSSENMFRGVADAQSELYYDGTKSMETTSTGIKVSGTKLEQYGSGEVQLMIGSTNAGGAAIYFDGDSDGNFVGSDYSWILHNTSGDMEYVVDNPAAAGNHIFKTGGATERLRIDSSGRVLIGTTSADDTSQKLKLHQAGNDHCLLNLNVSNSSYSSLINFGDSGSWSIGQISYVHSDDSLRFKVNAAERLRIKSDGNIGIGTNTATSKLEIFAPPLNATTVNTTTCKQLGLWINPSGTGNNTTGNIYNGIALSDGFAGLYGYDAGASAATGLGFFTGNVSAVAERLRITSGGDVGIGIDAPTARLFVNGVSTSPIITARAADSNGNSIINILSEGTTGSSRINFSDTAGIDGQVSYSHSARALIFATAGTTERLKIDSGGRLLLGTQRTYSSATWYDDITINNSNGSGQTGGTGITLISASNSWGSFLFGDGDNNSIGAIKYDHNTNSLRFVVNSIDPAVIITSAGLFGIGTNAPANLLQVEGSAPVIAIRDTASYSAYSNGGKIYFQGKDSNGNVKTFGGVLGVSQSSNNGQLRLQTRTGGTLYDRMTINASGGVGIGTDNFASDLDNRPGLAIHSNHNDSCRLLITTPTKSPTRLGYYGLNRFGIDVQSGFEVRDVAASYATRFKIDNNGYITKPNQPNFVTHSTNSDGSNNSNNFLNIGNTYINIGSHYNTGNGRFTCPATGVYFFYCCWTSDSSTSSPVIYFWVNGNQSQNGALNYNSQYAGTYNGQCFSLNTNDYVQCSMRDWNNSTPSPWQTWWGGYLLQ